MKRCTVFIFSLTAFIGISYGVNMRVNFPGFKMEDELGNSIRTGQKFMFQRKNPDPLVVTDEYQNMQVVKDAVGNLNWSWKQGPDMVFIEDLISWYNIQWGYSGSGLPEDRSKKSFLFEDWLDKGPEMTDVRPLMITDKTGRRQLGKDAAGSFKWFPIPKPNEISITDLIRWYRTQKGYRQASNDAESRSDSSSYQNKSMEGTRGPSNLINMTSWNEGEDCIAYCDPEMKGSCNKRNVEDNRALNDDNCGKIRARSPRIIGGKEAGISQYPWNVAIKLRWGYQICGGSLINEYYVLTAAHCVAWGQGAVRMRLSLGDHLLTSTSEVQHLERGISTLKFHAKYDDKRTDYDIALIKMSEPVQLGGNIETICLPTTEQRQKDYENSKAVVTGWGLTKFQGQASDVLRVVEVSMMSNKECGEKYKGLITDRMICAGEPEGGKDACQGDSGGPLVIMDKVRRRWFQAGVVSWGHGCAAPNKPGVYANIFELLDWVQRHSRN